MVEKWKNDNKKKCCTSQKSLFILTSRAAIEANKIKIAHIKTFFSEFWLTVIYIIRCL